VPFHGINAGSIPVGDNLAVLTKKPGCSAEVSAFVLETKGREFKSHHPDQIKSKVLVNG